MPTTLQPNMIDILPDGYLTRMHRAGIFAFNTGCYSEVSSSRSLDNDKGIVAYWLQNARETQVTHLQNEVADLLKQPNDNDFIARPTEYARQTLLQIIRDTYARLTRFPNSPSVGPDGYGGLSVEWKARRKVVRLVIHESAQQRMYIYSRRDKDSDVNYEVSAKALAQSLRNMFG